MKLMRMLWNDEAGFVVSMELVLVASIAVLGMIVGLASVRDGVTSELSDVAGTVNDLYQGYDISQVIGHSATVAGSHSDDTLDFCEEDGVGDPAGINDQCIVYDFSNVNGEPGPWANGQTNL